jgi:hypothetical protein
VFAYVDSADKLKLLYRTVNTNPNNKVFDKDLKSKNRLILSFRTLVYLTQFQNLPAQRRQKRSLSHTAILSIPNLLFSRTQLEHLTNNQRSH